MMYHAVVHGYSAHASLVSSVSALQDASLFFHPGGASRYHNPFHRLFAIWTLSKYRACQELSDRLR